jgi:hypothetical protein
MNTRAATSNADAEQEQNDDATKRREARVFPDFVREVVHARIIGPPGWRKHSSLT